MEKRYLNLTEVQRNNGYEGPGNYLMFWIADLRCRVHIEDPETASQEHIRSEENI